MKYWKYGNPEENDGIKCFSFYEIKELSFGYFISNLLEIVYQKTGNGSISEHYRELLYPIPQGKEPNRLKNLEVKLNSV